MMAREVYHPQARGVEMNQQYSPTYLECYLMFSICNNFLYGEIHPSNYISHYHIRSDLSNQGNNPPINRRRSEG